MGDEGRMGEKKTVGGRKRAGERDFSFLINLSDPVPLMPVPAYPTAPASAGSGRQRQAADLAEIQSRFFYQPPEVDLTPLFLDSESG